MTTVLPSGSNSLTIPLATKVCEFAGLGSFPHPQKTAQHRQDRINKRIIFRIIKEQLTVPVSLLESGDFGTRQIREESRIISVFLWQKHRLNHISTFISLATKRPTETAA
jgi:hypothetical protein